MKINDGKTRLSAFVVHGDLMEISITSEIDNNTRIDNRVLLTRGEAERLLSELQEFIERTKT